MPQERKRVLHIIDSFNMGGAETWLVEIVRHATERRPDMPVFDFVAAGGVKAIFDEEIIGHGCRIYYLKLDRGNTGPFIRGLRDILRNEAYAAIHDHQDFLSGWHFLFGAGLLPPVRISHVHNPYYQMHNNYGVTFKRRMNLRIGRMLLRGFATHILGTSAKVMGEYGMVPKAYPRQRVAPLHCAFRIDKFTGTHADHKEALCSELGWDASRTRIVLFAGRMDVSTSIGHPNNHKNSAFALEVLRAVEDPDVRMVMAGANDYVYEAFMALVREKGMEERVRLLGIRKDMPHLMSAAEVLLFPSRSEGMGMVAVEAQASGLPVLASDVVPDEVVVLDELVRFRSLESPFTEWASDLEALMGMRKEADTSGDARWDGSSFNIDVCCTRLAACYRDGSINH